MAPYRHNPMPDFRETEAMKQTRVLEEIRDTLKMRVELELKDSEPADCLCPGYHFKDCEYGFKEREARYLERINGLMQELHHLQARLSEKDWDCGCDEGGPTTVPYVCSYHKEQRGKIAQLIGRYSAHKAFRGSEVPDVIDELTKFAEDLERL